ncbi:MAG: DMT family transporter [Chitinophagales bacterium]|nr:DMT family transporter [Chitinophagales bacterium]MCZ2393317.1 DMT family transporter [Chitinophagales bacterium]
MRNAYIYLHLSVLLAGLTGIFGRLIQLNEGLLVWYRILLASIVLGGILIYKQSKISYPIKDILSISKSGIILTIHWLLFFASIKYSNVSIAVVCFGLTGFNTSILHPIIKKQKFNLLEIALSLITLSGIILIFHFDIQYRFGILLGIASSLFSALYTIFNEDLVKKYDSTTLNFYQISAGTIFLTLVMPLYLKMNPTTYLFPNMTDWLYIFILSILCTVVLYILFNESLKNISAFTVNLTYNLEPIYSIILAFILFKENKELEGHFYIGMILVLLAVVLQSLLTYKRSKKKTIS